MHREMLIHCAERALPPRILLPENFCPTRVERRIDKECRPPCAMAVRFRNSRPLQRALFKNTKQTIR